MIQVIVDSTCDMPKEWREKYKIKVLPLIVNLNDKEYKDGEEIQLEDLYESMTKGIIPKTSQVPAEIMRDVFTGCCEDGNDFIYVAFSSKMSGTFDLAHMIIQELKESYPERKTALVDSKGGSLATGLIVNEVCKYIERNDDLDEAVKVTENLVEHIEHLFTISNLEWLSKGGRISKPLGYIGNVLNIKPILDVEEGKMAVIKMVRGRKKALKEVVEKLVQSSQKFQNQIIGLTHAGDLETAMELKSMIEEKIPMCKTVICQIGCVLGVHLGIGGVGAFFFNDRISPEGV